MRGLILTMSMLLLSACSSTPRSPRPPLPSPAFDKIPAESRELTRAAWEAANKAPDDPEPNGRLGMMLLTLEQFAPAAAAFERASQEQPENFSWIYYLGVAQAQSGHPAPALATFRKALRMRSSFVPLQLRYVEALVATGRSQEAEKACHAILLEHPDAAPAHRILAAIYRSSGQAMRADDESTQAEKFAELPADTLEYLKDPWIAAVSRPKPLTEAPPKTDERTVHFAKGRELMAKKQFKKAIDELLKTLSPKDGDTPGYLYSLSTAYSLADDMDNAVKYALDAKEMAIEQKKTVLSEAIEQHLQRLRAKREAAQSAPHQ